MSRYTGPLTQRDLAMGSFWDDFTVDEDELFDKISDPEFEAAVRRKDAELAAIEKAKAQQAQQRTAVLPTYAPPPQSNRNTLLLVGAAAVAAYFIWKK